ncbi:hypothetical protein ACRRTK_017681 [Alexandromys fortis]
MLPESCANLLTEFTHACVLNTRSECEVGCVHVCVVVMQVCVCVHVCLSSWLLCGPGFRAPWKELVSGQAVAAKQAKG